MAKLDELFAGYDEAREMLRDVPDALMSHSVPRDWAVDVLTAVTDATSCGAVADGVTLEDIGWALHTSLARYDIAEVDEIINRVREGFFGAEMWVKAGQRPELAEA